MIDLLDFAEPAEVNTQLRDEVADAEVRVVDRVVLPEGETALAVHVIRGDECEVLTPLRHLHFDPDSPMRVALLAYEPTVVRDHLTDLGEAGYHLRQPIPYLIRKLNNGTFEASLDEANIAIGGSDPHDAYQALVAEILDTFDTLIREEGNLGLEAERQLRVLKQYIVRR